MTDIRLLYPMMQIKKYRLLPVLAFTALLCGCASFNSGDIRVERSAARAMLDDRTIVPFSDIKVSWRNFPYRSPTESIGEGSISNPLKVKPVPVPGEDSSALADRAREIFRAAGLYDREKGRGTLRLELTSFGRWTYGDLFHSYLAETGFIFIIPSSLRVNYGLTADFAVSTGTARVETIGQRKTVFHLLLAPLYPFFAPGQRENSLLKQMLWRTATDVYTRLKAAGGAAGELPPVRETNPDPDAIPAPPMTPDRSWLPGASEQTAPDGTEPIKPEKPDKTWIVPGKQPAAPAREIKPAPAGAQETPAIIPDTPDKTWTVPVTTAAPGTAPQITPAQSDRTWKTQEAAPGETPDD